jgi:glycosyltransferase involved in cell wall biosynthesis
MLDRRLGDGLRFFGLLSPLARSHAFDLVRLGELGEQPNSDEKALFEHISVVPYPRFPRPTGSRRFARKLKLSGFKIQSSDMHGEIRRLLAAYRHDLILEAGGNAMLNIPPEPLQVPIVVDSIDEPLLRDARALAGSTWSHRLTLAHRMWMFWRYERTQFARVDVNIYASEVDARIYGRLFPGRRVVALANGVDTDYFAPVQPRTEGATIVFEGNMNFGPNIDAARRLAQEVLPRVRESVPDARAVIVGREPTADVLALQSSCVNVTGTVDDVRPYLSNATVFACPMRLGSGIKNKILQAWSMELPVVATTASLGGLDARNGENLMVRDSMDSFADAIVQLIQSPELARRIGSSGRSTIVATGTWEVRARELERLLHEAVDRRSATSRETVSAA